MRKFLEDAMECDFGERNGVCEAEVGEDFRVDFAEDADGLAVDGECGGAAGDEGGVVDGCVLDLPAEFAKEGVDGAAGGGVAAFAADFDEGEVAFFGGAGFGRVVEIDDVIDFEEPDGHGAAAVFAESFEQAAHQVRADDVVSFEFRVGDLRIPTGSGHSQALELVLLGRQRQAHDLAEAQADENLADAVAKRLFGTWRADGHRADEARLDVGVAVADGDVFEEIDHVANVGTVGGEGAGRNWRKTCYC